MVLIQKERYSFGSEKSEKRLFCCLKHNYFTFKLFSIPHGDSSVNLFIPNNCLQPFISKNKSIDNSLTHAENSVSRFNHLYISFFLHRWA